MNRNGELKTIGIIVDTLDFLEKQSELPSLSEIAKAHDTELEEIAEKASDIISQIKDVQTHTDDLFEHPL